MRIAPTIPGVTFWKRFVCVESKASTNAIEPRPTDDHDRLKGKPKYQLMVQMRRNGDDELRVFRNQSFILIQLQNEIAGSV